MTEHPDDRRGIGSVETAMTVLGAFARARGPLSLTELGARTGMSPSKLHRYLASLVGAGMLVQPARSGHYDLGPFAAELGLAALARRDAVNDAAALLPDLTAKTGRTAMLSVWGASGPTVVRWERGPDHLVTALGLGSVLPVMGSATGRVFLAHLPKSATALHIPKGQTRQADAHRVAVRTAGYAAVGGDFIPGLHAIAAPVLNWQGEAEAAVTLIGTDARLTDPKGPAVAALTAACRAASIPS